MNARTLDAPARAPERGPASDRTLASRARRTAPGSAQSPLQVIVAFDGSPASNDALALGALLATPAHSELVVACVYPPESSLGVLSFEPRPTRTAGGDYRVFTRHDAEEALAEARGALPDEATASFRALECESAAEGLRRFARQEAADVLVVGSAPHGLLGWPVQHRLARGLLRNPPCAVTVAPASRRRRLTAMARGRSASTRASSDREGSSPRASAVG